MTESLLQKRRRIVKRAGRRFIKAVADLMARQSLVADKPVHDTTDYPFIATIETDWRKIRAELEPLLADRARLPPFHEISPDQKYISHGDHWKVFILFGFGVASERNCARCPETARLLRGVPGLQSALFSILAPRYHIPTHRGVTKSLLRAHLGLVIPEQRENCRMRVGDATVCWEQGRCVVFDDFYLHEVWNDTDEERVVLIFDFERPMRPLGRLINAALMWGIKRTAYFKDGERNLKNWDERLESAAQTADKMMDEAPPPG
jgi:aspartyl/asparaginyl beta-hydroxylase (cupin superfamily)